MRKLYLFSILFLIFYSSAYGLEHLDYLHVISYEGDVAIKKNDTGDWIQIDLNMPVEENDTIWVPKKSRLELRTKNGSFVRLNEYTLLDVLLLSDNGFQFYSEGGDLYVNYKSDNKTILQIDSPTVTIKAYDNAKFRIEIFDDGETDVTVVEGNVVVMNKGLKVTLKENEKASFNEEELLEKGKVYSFDEWERWNISRDNVFNDIPKSVRYLPDELHPYAYDFDYNGVWVYVKEFGYVWQPTVIITSDWAPYRHGYWIWIKGDYVWISLEPWGWVPYHYGRWVYTKKYGWVWVPPSRGLVYWGPGYVGWVYTTDYVCWVPLAPGEIYYGYGYYGPYSVNIVNVKINVTNVVYKNINAPNGYVVIHRNNFLTAKQIYEKNHENPFLSRKAVYGRPDFYKDGIKKVVIGRKFVVDERKIPKILFERKIEMVKERKPFVIKESPERVKNEKEEFKEKKPKKEVDRDKGVFHKEELKPSKTVQQEEIKPVVKERKILKKREKFREGEHEKLEKKKLDKKSIEKEEKLKEKPEKKDKDEK